MVDTVSNNSASPNVAFSQFEGTFKNDYEGYGKALANLVNTKGDSLKANGRPITPAQLAKTEFGMDGNVRANAGAWDQPFHGGDSAAAASFVNNLNPDRLKQIASDPKATRALSDSLQRINVSIDGPKVRYTEGTEPAAAAKAALTKLAGAQRAAADDARMRDSIEKGGFAGMNDACGFAGCPMPTSTPEPKANLHTLTGDAKADHDAVAAALNESPERDAAGTGVFAGGMLMRLGAEGGVTATDLYGRQAQFAPTSPVSSSVRAILGR